MKLKVLRDLQLALPYPLPHGAVEEAVAAEFESAIRLWSIRTDAEFMADAADTPHIVED